MCLALNEKDTIKLPNGIVRKNESLPKSAAEVPLGDGLADAARLSILSRRERIRSAVEG